MPKLAALLGPEIDDPHIAALIASYPTVEQYLIGASLHGDDPATALVRAVIDAAIASKIAPPRVSGVALFERLRDQQRLVPTGCIGIDAMLRGGIREAQLTEVVGESGTGKSQLCMGAAAEFATRAERVLYVDTTNAFSAARVAGMVAARLERHEQEGAQQPLPCGTVSAAMRCILVARPHSAHELLALLDQAAALMERNQDPNARLRAVIIDSVAAVMAPILGGQQHCQGHAILMSVARALRQIAFRHSIAVLTTNHMVSAGVAAVGGTAGGTGTHQSRPALGEYWRNQAHARLLLTHTDDGRRSATVAASTFTACGERVWFVINHLGLHCIDQYAQ